MFRFPFEISVLRSVKPHLLSDCRLHNIHHLNKGHLSIHVPHVLLHGGILEHLPVVNIVLIMAETFGVLASIFLLPLPLPYDVLLVKSPLVKRHSFATSFEVTVLKVVLTLVFVLGVPDVGLHVFLLVPLVLH